MSGKGGASDPYEMERDGNRKDGNRKLEDPHREPSPQLAGFTVSFSRGYNLHKKSSFNNEENPKKNEKQICRVETEIGGLGLAENDRKTKTFLQAASEFFFIRKNSKCNEEK
ncbi:Hypothetical protein NTJ_05266 [Nesidiocoris tenuis]|uniref:Uncharacterized protein n=1 Tax=Nesidiocoris tenuis TaxID=355587 RepID=A0ABN7AJM8_9HEMI|nr:Hypothetical protein NTJ_05266 [Nesidiocoris tenuis]